MKVSQFAPSPALMPFVRVLEIVESDVLFERTLVPDAGLILGFRFAGRAFERHDSGDVAMPVNVVSGLRASARTMLTTPGSGMVLAKFRDAGASAFFDVPLHELFGDSVQLADVLPRAEVDDAALRVQCAKTNEERVGILERFLLRRLVPERVDAVVVAAARAIRSNPALVRVNAVADDLDISVDALEKRFRRSVGASPKHLASLLRLRQVVGAHKPTMTLTQLALETGYYDQAHFNRHFVAVMGRTPSVFFKQVSYCL